MSDEKQSTLSDKAPNGSDDLGGQFEAYPEGHVAQIVSEAEAMSVIAKAHRASLAASRKPTPPATPTSFTARELQLMPFPPIRFIIPGLIPEGLTILGGRPKIGKSWLCLDISSATALGGFAFGNIQVEQGDAVYYALEDHARRLQSRLKQVLRFENWPERLSIRTVSPRLDRGLIKQLTSWIESVPNPRMIILDTFGKIKSKQSNNDKSGAYDNDYSELTPLQKLAAEFQIAIVLVHHQRKMDADDPLDTISGSIGLTGAADTTLVLHRKAAGTTLYGRGRDIEEFEKAVKFDAEFSRWVVFGEASEVNISDARKAILAAIGDREMSISEIMVATGALRNNVHQLLFKLGKDGMVEKSSSGRYKLKQTQANVISLIKPTYQ